jgi:hypothetical protein
MAMAAPTLTLTWLSLLLCHPPTVSPPPPSLPPHRFAGLSSKKILLKLSDLEKKKEKERQEIESSVGLLQNTRVLYRISY